VSGGVFLFSGLGVLLLSVLLVLSGDYRPSIVEGSNAEAVVSLIQAADRNDKTLETGLLAGVTYTSGLIYEPLSGRAFRPLTARPIRMSDIPKSTVGTPDRLSGICKLAYVRGSHIVRAVWFCKESCMHCDSSISRDFNFNGKKLLEVRNVVYPNPN
jgi:hypothetical protein